VTELVSDARELAAALLDVGALADRWRHVQGVACRAAQLAVTVDPDDRELLVAAAWLHDIGYASSLVSTGMHALDGAIYLQSRGWPLRLTALIAQHSGARFEAAERGLTGQLDEFPLETGPVMDALVTADLTVGPDGQQVDVEARIVEILHRYPPETAVHRAVQRARSVLLGHVQQTLAIEAGTDGAA
jgi:putative nucleotidyltransferase with HDIG domain